MPYAPAQARGDGDGESLLVEKFPPSLHATNSWLEYFRISAICDLETGNVSQSATPRTQ